MGGGAVHFLYFELLPSTALRPWVHSCWGFDVHPDLEGPVEHTVWPDGCLSLVVRFPAAASPTAAWTGARTEPLGVPVAAGERYRGFRLRPDAAGVLLGCDPLLTRERGGPARDLLGDEAADLEAIPSPEVAFEALDRVLAARAREARPLDPLVRRAVESIVLAHGAMPVREIAAAVGLSERQFRRRFRAATGLSPKEYARVRRLRATAAERLEGGAPWSDLAARFGYADQAHLAHEVARMTGLTPTAFEQRVQRIEHRNVRP